MKQINEIIKSQNLELQSEKQATDLERSATLLEKTLLNSFRKGTRLNDLSIADTDKLLLILAKLVGIKTENFPDREESLLIIRSLNRMFPNTTDEELKTAFELVGAGKLDTDEHYQHFNFKYISAIINSYARAINEASKYVQHKAIEEKPLFEQEVDWTDTINYLIDEAVNKNDNLLIPLELYQWCIDKGIIVATKQMKANAMNLAHKKYYVEVTKRWTVRPNSVDRAELYSLERGYKKGDQIYDRVANLAKKLIVKDYILERAKEKIKDNT